MQLLEVARRFAIEGRVLAAQPLGRGHINETAVVEVARGTGRARYVLQRINRRVFADPAAVMDNITRVLAHLRARLGDVPDDVAARQVLTLVPALDGRSHWQDDAGESWRAFRFIEGARTLAAVDTESQAHSAARAFGHFLHDLTDLAGPPLHETIPGFHDTPAYLARLQAAIEADPHNRAAGARAAIDDAVAREPLAGALARWVDPALLRPRVTHNDTKVDNVLFDAESDATLAVIDLDTVMPGLALHDFGDLARSAVSAGPEDDPARAVVRPHVFDALASGFSAGLGAAIERPALALAAQVITYECSLRFLTDHLQGDGYFRIHRPGQNLDRARTQLALVGGLERLG